MKKLSFVTIITLWAVFLWILFSIRAGNGQSLGPLKYDTETVETLTGKIMEVQTVPCNMGRMGQGVHLLLKTDGQLVSVHLGPERFINKQKLSFAQNDVISITGSRVKIASEDAVLAASLTKGSKKTALRKEDGTPLWKGQGYRRSRN